MKTYIDKQGYFRFKDSKRLVHRWVAYKKIYKKGLYLLPFSSYVIHHRNKNKLDNNVENLELLWKS